jgi:hypothetical protein
MCTLRGLNYISVFNKKKYFFWWARAAIGRNFIEQLFKPFFLMKKKIILENIGVGKTLKVSTQQKM